MCLCLHCSLVFTALSLLFYVVSTLAGYSNKIVIMIIVIVIVTVATVTVVIVTQMTTFLIC